MTEREIFTAALSKKDPAERAAFLNEACAGNAPLRQRVDSLLAEYPQLGSFMDASSPAATLAPSPLERPGTQIGPHKLLQQIGEGGMGTVFMAEQTQPVQRKVALKVIKAGMDSRHVIARFEAERQALAMMDHVNIARVLDAGATESGRPYFVMELVHGVPITKYCDDNHLTPRQRLELFVSACQAIQHAHQKGIIHRDIKPSNVMVTLYDGKPVPKVIDFGVAKATEQKLTERTMFTQYGTMVGTLEYMSPEQAEMSALGVDTRSDIYSLGVLLYELLTGSTPLGNKRIKEAAYAEILRMIKEEEPPIPSTRLSDSGESLASISAQRHMEPAKLTKLIRGELDWIAMKALDKDRNRRYETAASFAADINRYLNDEPVHACPPSVGYRFRKFVRRNKHGVLAGSAIAVALIVGTVLASIGLIQARRQAEIARAQGARSEQVAQFLREMLTSINPDAQVGAAVTVQQMLDRAGEKIDHSFASEPDIRARLHGTMGETYYGIQLYAPASRHFQMAVDLRRQYLPEERIELAQALLSLGQCETVMATNLKNALANCREAAAIFSTTVPESDSRRAFANALVGHLASGAAGESEAQKWSATALPLLLLFPDDQLARWPPEMAQAIASAKRLYRAGDSDGAGAALRRWRLVALEKSQKLCAAGDLAAVRQFVHEYVAPTLDVPWARPIAPLALVNRAQLMKSAGENTLLIEAVLREAVEAGHIVWGSEHPQIARGLHELAALLRDQGRLDEAVTTAREAFEMRRKVLGREHPETTKSREVLIEVLRLKGSIDEAEKLRAGASNGVEIKQP